MAKVVKTYEAENDNQYTYHEVKGAAAFHKAITAAKEGNDHGAFVHAYDEDEYAGKRLFLSTGGEAGFALTDDGDIVSVFHNPKIAQPGKKGVATHMLLIALQNGGKKLDCFDGFLPKLYAKLGFQPASKLKFNREYAPEGWNYERDGEPDVVFMYHNGDSYEEVRERMANNPYDPPNLENVPYADDYDHALELRDKASGELRKSIDKKTITREQAKKVHKDLPPGGVWRTIRGNHVYIKDGAIIAGVGVGKTGKPVKLTKKELAEHFAALKQANKEKKKAAAKEPSAKTTTKKTSAKTTTKKTSAKTTTKKTSDKKPAIKHVVKPNTTKKPKAGTSEKPKHPDYSKMPRQELDAHYRETWRKHEQEAQELYGNKLDELKRKYKELQDKGAEISKQRKSKAREAALEANRREMDANLKEQARIWSEQQEHIRKQKESHPIYAEVRRRNEADDRKRTGDLLPEESAKLRKELGAKEFDPSAPKEKFYRRKGEQWDSRAVSGVPIDLGHGIEGFIHRSDNGSEYTVHVARTGEPIIHHYPNSEQAGEGDEANYRRAANLAHVKMHTLVHGDDFRSGMGKDRLKERLSEIEERYGVSPRYNDDGSIKAGMDKSRSGQAPKVYTYHTRDRQGNWSEQTGTKVSVHPDLTTFLHKDEDSGKYVVTEARSGLSMGYDDTKSGALDKAKNAVANMGIEKVKNLLSQHISKKGESPSWGENLRKSLIESERKLLEDWRREEWQR